MAIWEGVRGGFVGDGLEEEEDDEGGGDVGLVIVEAYPMAIAAVIPAARKIAPGYDIWLSGLTVIFDVLLPLPNECLRSGPYI